MRGFDIRGVGPRVIRYAATYDPLNPVIDTSNDNRGQIDDALGGRAYYQGRIELDIPLGTGAKELGLRPSIFLDVGSVFSVKRPTLTTRSEEHTSELQSLMRNSSAVFCLKKQK